jgi:uncharacterized caspase-like protein
MRVVGTIVLAILSNWLFSQSAIAEKRVALAIGNSTYQHVSHLTNPANDAAVMTAMFKKADFDVVDSRVDLSVTEMRRVLRDFADKARDADIAVIYYAGHGIEIDGMNYLVPVDAVLERDTDVYDEAFALDRVLVAIEPARQLRLIILDACRDNPFARTMKRTIGLRAIGRGLAKVEPSNPNTLVAFAAKAGFTAFDGDDKKTSPFAAALAEHLTKPGLDLRKAFGFVRDDVLKATNNKQEPFIYGSLGGNDVALVLAPAVPPQVNPASDSNASVRHDYELAERVGTREAWEFFLSTYPNGFYAKLAQAQRNKLAAEEARIAATEKARLAAEEQTRLAAEGAKAAEQARAASQARAAEEARIAAEKKKSLEETKLAEAERAKAAAQAKAAEDARIAADKAKKIEEAKANLERIAADKKVLEEARLAEAERRRVENDRVARERSEQEKMQAEMSAKQKMTALTPNETLVGPAPSRLLADGALVEEIKKELKRVGCYTGPIDDNWTTAETAKSIKKFIEAAHASASPDQPTNDFLDALRGRSARVCPLECGAREVEAGGQCVAKRCATGYGLDEDGDCVKQKDRRKVGERSHEAAPSIIKGPPAAPPSRGPAVVDNTRVGPGKVTEGGVTTCGPKGCQFVPKNCRAVTGAGGHGLGGRIFCP